MKNLDNIIFLFCLVVGFFTIFSVIYLFVKILDARDNKQIEQQHKRYYERKIKKNKVEKEKKKQTRV